MHRMLAVGSRRAAGEQADCPARPCDAQLGRSRSLRRGGLAFRTATHRIGLSYTGPMSEGQMNEGQMNEGQMNEGGDRLALRLRLKMLWREYRALDLPTHPSDLERWRKADSILREIIEMYKAMGK